jgi:Ala-tRNA(Pro) deacylase
MQYHKVVSQIEELLKARNISYKKFEHEPVRTSEEASRVRGDDYTLSQGAKALIVRVKKGGVKEFAMIVVSGDKKFDVGKVKKLLEAKDIRFASEEEVKEITGGIEPGGVPPFGNLFGLTVIADEGVFENEEIIFNAGDRRVSIAVKSEDYRQVVEPKVSVIV